MSRKPMADSYGQVYEQFLGKVIRLTAGHQAKVEEKPEVRKAGGVYNAPRSRRIAGAIGPLTCPCCRSRISVKREEAA